MELDEKFASGKHSVVYLVENAGVWCDENNALACFEQPMDVANAGRKALERSCGLCGL